MQLNKGIRGLTLLFKLCAGIFVSSHLSLGKNEFTVVGESSQQALSLALWRHFCPKKDKISQHVGTTSSFRGVFKMQVLWRATIYCSRGCLFATWLQLVWKVKFQRKRSKRRSKVHSCGILDQGELQRGKKWSISLPSMPCLSDFTIKLTVGNVSMYGICAGCVCVLCVGKKRAQNQE